jgi:hypothetical protein
VNSTPPEQLPATPEEAALIEAVKRQLQWRAYRKSTRPYRRAFRGIISRRDAERFYKTTLRQYARHMAAMEEALSE